MHLREEDPVRDFRHVFSQELPAVFDWSVTKEDYKIADAARYKQMS